MYTKWSLPKRISSVNLTKSAVTADLVTFTEEILNGKRFCAVKREVLFYNYLLFLNILHLHLQCDMFYIIISVDLIHTIIYLMLKIHTALHKKWSFPLRIFSVNLTKSAVSCGFGHIDWRNPKWKASFFVQYWVCFIVANRLHNICGNAGFYRPVFSRIRIES